MRHKIFAVLALILGVWSVSAFGQGTGRVTVWNGIYTEAQATQGQAVFSARCSRCHGTDLNGAAVGTSLIGDRFMQFWREDTVVSLFTKIRDTMPRNAGGSLSDDEYVQVTAYILQKNGFPAGPAELKPDTMSLIHIEGKDGPQPLPNNSMIQVVGCMTSAENDTWTLTQSSAPVRTRTPNAISPEELKIAERTLLGTATFRLQNMIMLGSFKPDAHAGHKMLAKGPLIRRSNAETISVTALEMVEDRCAQ